MIPVSFLLLLIVPGLALAADRDSLPSKRAATPTPRDFPIMAWGDTPADLMQLKGMKDAGFNISGFCPPSILADVSKAELVCFVDDPRVNGYRWTQLPDDTEIRSKLQSLKKEIAGQSAAFGIYVKDEPVMRQLPGLGKVTALLREIMPDRLPYINLFPYELHSRILGGDYEAYAHQLHKVVGQPYLSYDNYGLVNGEMLDYFYTNLEIIRRVSEQEKVPFWNCILSVAHNNYMEPTEASLHLQVYSTLAYGGRGIEYFRYFTRGIGDYRLGAIDQFGDRTATWGMVRRVNGELAALAPIMLQLRSVGVFHNAPVPDQAHSIAESRLISEIQTNLDVEGEGYLVSREMLYRKFGAAAPPKYLLGEFEDAHRRPYILLVNKDLSRPFRFRIQARKQSAKFIRISPYTGQEEPFEGEMDWLAAGSGILLRLE